MEEREERCSAQFEYPQSAACGERFKPGRVAEGGATGRGRQTSAFRSVSSDSGQNHTTAVLPIQCQCESYCNTTPKWIINDSPSFDSRSRHGALEAAN